MKFALFILALVAAVHADMYLHNPRGSNNRLDEARRERNNANRCFDSQNNNRGGYNVGNLYYYEGSVLPIEWTNQHSCADQNSHCDIIIQYMCSAELRDGSSTNRIPDQPVQCEDYNCNTDLEFGMHEDYHYYLNCRLRERNKGLFTSDRQLKGDSAIYTRQNNNGQRRGYECPEERDYYPYWHPTPWRDIAILTNNAMRCPYYKNNSENSKPRSFCDLPRGYINEKRNVRTPSIPITKEKCEEIVWPAAPAEGKRGVWTKSTVNITEPECVESIGSRDNHLGNTRGGFPIYYNWTIPNIQENHCVIRIRYNISTGDYDQWDDSSLNGSLKRTNEDVYDGGNRADQLSRKAISNVSNIYTQFGMDFEEGKKRGYVLRQNPVVRPFPVDTPNGKTFGLQLAINTNQFGRTFQDRSHMFAIRRRPDDLKDAVIHNLNVRGKRGNIVQVYPGVEYDFVPNTLLVSIDDYVHIQWTGSNTNPNNNDGQGKQGTDRSNVVLLRESTYAEGTLLPDKMGHWGRSYPQHLDSNYNLLGFTREDRDKLANTLDGGEMSELDDAGTYFDLGPRKVTSIGIYHYLCTRNNNFSNRSQKGKFVVIDYIRKLVRIGWNGGNVQLKNNTLTFAVGALNVASEYTMTELSNRSEAMKIVGRDLPPNTVSEIIMIDPPYTFLGSQEEAQIELDLKNEITSAAGVTIFRASAESNWYFESLDTSVEDGKAVAQTSKGGVFVAGSKVATGAVVGILVAVAIFMVIAILVTGVVIYFKARPEKWESAKSNMSKTQMKVKRSFARQV